VLNICLYIFYACSFIVYVCFIFFLTSSVVLLSFNKLLFLS
jgi:hypothetical protein